MLVESLRQRDRPTRPMAPNEGLELQVESSLVVVLALLKQPWKIPRIHRDDVENGHVRRGLSLLCEGMGLHRIPVAVGTTLQGLATLSRRPQVCLRAVRNIRYS